MEKSVPKIAVWHQEACRVMTNGDPEGRIFLSYPHTNNVFVFLLTTVFYFKISFQKSLNAQVLEFMNICYFFWPSLQFHPNNCKKMENEKKENYDQTDSKKKQSLSYSYTRFEHFYKSLNRRTFVI